MAGAAVAVNLLWCVPGDVGGSEEYFVRQLLGLAEADPNVQVRLFVVSGFEAAHPELVAHFPTTVAAFDGMSRARRIAGEMTWFRRRAAAAALRHHGGGIAPIGGTSPYVLTIHDLQYRTFPEHFSRSKRTYLAAMTGRSARHASVVAVPSEYVRTTVIDTCHTDPARVMVVPHGFEADLLSDITPEDVLRQRYALGDQRILLYPAVTHPHKNHQFLIELLATTWRDDDRLLVLIGGTGTAEGVVRAAGDPRIRRLGRVPAADRNGLLRMADAMVFPSKYEGFGAPLIEAMALSCPVIASDSTCIPSILDDAGLVMPLTSDAWADALDRVGRERDRLIAAGLARSQAFTARASGQALAAVYAAALARP